MRITRIITSVFATADPKLVTFGIGLAITVAIGAALGVVEPEQAFAAGKKGQGV